MIKKLFIIFIIIGSLYLTSCKKKNLDYMYVGIYIEVLDDQNKTMDDEILNFIIINIPMF